MIISHWIIYKTNYTIYYVLTKCMWMCMLEFFFFKYKHLYFLKVIDIKKYSLLQVNY